MPGKQRQHMVEKRDAGPNPGPAFSVYIQTNPDPGLAGIALYGGLARLHQPDLNGMPTQNKAELLRLRNNSRLNLAL